MTKVSFSDYTQLQSGNDTLVSPTKMSLLLCFLWRATVSAWIYGKVLRFCSKLRLALSVKKDGKGTVHLQCCHTAGAIPWLFLHQQLGHRTSRVPDLLVTPRSPVGSQHSSLLSFPLRNDDSICSDDGEPSSTCAPAADCPGDVTVTGQDTATSSSALGHPAASSCQPLLPPSRLQALRGFHQLKCLAYKQKMFLFPTAEPCSSLSSKHSHISAS